jgi:hypothetical protein
MVAADDDEESVATAPQLVVAVKPLSDNFPTLPAVASMTGASTDMLKSLNAQAGALEARIAQGQVAIESKLNQQKAIFEGRLHSQEEANLVIVAQNDKIKKVVDGLKAIDDRLRTHSKQLEDAIHTRRTELRTLKLKLGVSVDFVDTSLKGTNLEGSPELAILATPQTVPKTSPTHQIAVVAVKEIDEDAGKIEVPAEQEQTEDDEEASDDEEQEQSQSDDDDDDDSADSAPAGTSLLMMSSRHRRVSLRDAIQPAAPQAGASASDTMQPHDLLHVLSQEVSSLAEQDQDGDAKLKKMFVEAFKKGNQRHTALLNLQKQLNVSRATMIANQPKLKVAEAQLMTKLDGVDNKLRGISHFLKKLAKLAVAPVAQADQLEKALPDVVTPQNKVAGIAGVGASLAHAAPRASKRK